MSNDILGKAIIVTVVLLIVVTGFFSIFYTYNEIKTEEYETNISDDRVIILNYAYYVLDDYFNTKNESMEKNPLESFNFIYHKLFITFICNGAIRGCQSGSADIKNSSRLYLDVEEATIECIKDDRFGGVLLKEELPEVEIVFTFLFNKSELESNDLKYLERNIELGIHAIEIDNNGDSAYFKESVPISHNYDLDYTLERLCIKAGLEDDAWADDETKIYKYDTLTFVGDRNDNVVELYRYNILVDVDDITNEKIYDSLSLAQSFFLNNVDPKTNLLEYRYYPSVDSYSSSNNDVRQLGCLWAITELDLFLETNVFDDLIENTLDYYLGFKETNNSYSYLTIDGSSKLAYNAFLILTLVNTLGYDNVYTLLNELGEGILSMQNMDGSFNTYFNSDSKSGENFYPGEAMLALMKLYQLTGYEKYLNSVEKAFPYYRTYWRADKNTAFIPWHSQVYWLLYQQTEDPELADFVFEMNDWIIDNSQIFEYEYVDKIGGFDYPDKNNPACSSSSYLEGINDAYSLAVKIDDKEHIEKYQNSLKIGARFILQTQFNNENTFYLDNPSRAIGGFKASLIDNTLRNDYTQHASMALLKVYKNEIFN